jgi:hypothetical protein
MVTVIRYSTRLVAAASGLRGSFEIMRPPSQAAQGKEVRTLWPNNRGLLTGLALVKAA